MENAQLIGLSRHVALGHQMDVVANNVANLNTVGFKAENLLYEEFVMPGAASNDAPGGSQDLSYTQDWMTLQDFSEGSITQTGNPLDLALQGPGFFTVQTPNGDRYTRNGTFKLDSSGLLVTNEGYPVVAEGSQIRFTAADTNIMIGADGSVRSDAGKKGKLKIAEFDEPQALTREGDNLYFGEVPNAATETDVVQGAIERSNVSGVKAIAEMIRVQRAYESIANMLKQQDELQRAAISTLGRVAA